MRRSWAILGVAAMLAAGGGWFALHRGGSRVAGVAAPAVGERPVPVIVAPVKQSDVPVTLTGIGSVTPAKTVVIRSRVDGQLMRLSYREGQDVHIGEVLAEIDPRTYQASLRQAEAALHKDEAQLANAEGDLRRFQDLATRQFASRQSVENQTANVAQLRAALEADRAQIDNAKVLLDYTTITAPIDGRAGIRQIDAGNIVHAGDQTGLVTISQLQPIDVIFTLPERVLPLVQKRLAEGALAVAAVGRDDKREFGLGVLTFIDNQIDTTTGTIRLKASFPNLDHALWPGQFINARLLVDTRRNVATIPTQAVQHGPNGAFVFVVAGDHAAEVRPIEVGQATESVTVVEHGLAVGEPVVVEGQYRLQAGTRVDEITAPQPAAPAPAQPVASAAGSAGPAPGAARGQAPGSAPGAPRS